MKVAAHNFGLGDKAAAPEETMFNWFCAEIDRDYAILSDAARQRLKDMIAAMAEDAHARGQQVRKA